MLKRERLTKTLGKNTLEFDILCSTALYSTVPREEQSSLPDKMNPAAAISKQLKLL